MGHVCCMGMIMIMGSMLQFAVGFVITPTCRGGRLKPKTRWNQKWDAGLIKAKQRKEESGKSVSQIQASSDRSTHKSKHKLRGGGREKQLEQKQGIKKKNA